MERLGIAGGGGFFQHSALRHQREGLSIRERAAVLREVCQGGHSPSRRPGVCTAIRSERPSPAAGKLDGGEEQHIGTALCVAAGTSLPSRISCPSISGPAQRSVPTRRGQAWAVPAWRAAARGSRARCGGGVLPSRADRAAESGLRGRWGKRGGLAAGRRVLTHADPIPAAVLARWVSPSLQDPVNVPVPMPHCTTLSESTARGLLLKEFNITHAHMT